MGNWEKCEPRKWQAEALPIIVEQLRQGKRPVVSAIMGSGKSVLIAELCNLALQKLKPNAHIVVCAPRQSLVRQLSQTTSRHTEEQFTSKLTMDSLLWSWQCKST